MKIHEYTVIPSLPERLSKLRDIAYNLYWTWDNEALSLWQRLDPDLWEDLDHNPVKILGSVTQQRLRELESDDSFLAHLDRVAKALDEYLEASTWFNAQRDDPDFHRIAYFSFEFGLTESLPIYSGGLGVLAGDHLKSASELGLPLVGMGLLYRRGYFRQYLNTDGWQQEYLPELDFYTLPVEPQIDSEGKPLHVSVKIGKREVFAQIWKVQVGRIPLYLLDTNIDLNHPEDQELTAQLYGGDTDFRIRQEILLGIGGQRALEVLGVKPSVYHMNEGHAAFLALERIRVLMKEMSISFKEARIATSAGNIFTTHTPVPAGNDRFHPEQMETYFSDYFQDFKLAWDEFLGLGREDEANHREDFCMTVLALKLSSYCNGVSKLHGEVSRKMWQNLFPNVPLDEIPITSITNGIHIRSWISEDLASLFDRYLGIGWKMDPVNTEIWKRVAKIPDAELWKTHERRAERLVSFSRERLKKQLLRRGLPRAEIRMAEEILDPDVLTIGFARRFATYKRATLLFSDPERLAKILNDPERPVQLIFAGKAHPADNQGKELIRQIVHYCRQEPFWNRVVFLEDYDMNVARYMVQGVDIWLNTPRRPMEASGTSGMKAAANGVLNLSILDGWWDEGYQQDNGWAIGSGEDYSDADYQNRVESEAIYEILEKDIIPLFYDRGRDGLPRGWIRAMKKDLMTNCPVFNTNRMLRQYSEMFYFPAAAHSNQFMENDLEKTTEVAEWEDRVLGHWSQVQISGVHADSDEEAFKVGAEVPVQVEVVLGDLDPEDVTVEVYHGRLNSVGEMVNGKVLDLAFTRKLANGHSLFEGSIQCQVSGRFGFAARVVASHPDVPVQDRLKNFVWG
ncbi:MAG: alpha-glucan family phosphorylase [Candidatus Omnitrophica bacterium]|nr:alpha-glucan family phosphorylase [Candidatus Omnitrophota bacterium]MCA9429660.1 alpha-glucan family phosphorylase [Candidatus Omnitrophota bacterium]